MSIKALAPRHVILNLHGFTCRSALNLSLTLLPTLIQFRTHLADGVEALAQPAQLRRLGRALGVGGKVRRRQ